MKPLTTHEEFCLKNAAHFVAACGRTPAKRHLRPGALRSCHVFFLIFGMSGQRARGGVVQNDGDHRRL